MLPQTGSPDALLPDVARTDIRVTILSKSSTVFLASLRYGQTFFALQRFLTADGNTFQSLSRLRKHEVLLMGLRRRGRTARSCHMMALSISDNLGSGRFFD